MKNKILKFKLSVFALALCFLCPNIINVDASETMQTFINCETLHPRSSLGAQKNSESIEDRITSEIEYIWELYKIGDSKRFRNKLSDLDIIPDEIIGELKRFTEQYLRDNIAKTVFKERGPRAAEKRVFESNSLDFVVGFAYEYDTELSPKDKLPKSFEDACERGGSLVGRAFYIRDVTLRYFDYRGNEKEIFVPYLLVQEKLTELGEKINEIKRKAKKFTEVDTDLMNDLMRQFIEIHKKMYGRGFMNWDIKIAVNYGVTRDNKVVLLDTGGIRKEKQEPIISCYIPMPFGVEVPDYEKELSQGTIESLWEADLDDIVRCTFINPDLEGPLRRIIEDYVRRSFASSSTHFYHEVKICS